MGFLLLVTGVAAQRMFWIPVAGPMFKKGKKHYATYRAPLSAEAGEASVGTVKLDCNAGDDADRLVLKASGMPPGAACKVWFGDARGKCLGDPLEATADADGHLHLTVFGDLCHLKQCPMLLVGIGERIVLRADLREPAPATPTASPSGGVGAPGEAASPAPETTPSSLPSP